ncbi:MAG: putative toxin-antitoxin system toxin component, PIN family [Betaproteobacteria bacterium]|nr:putative toxin-antitoxin system toxin component, PIN family [Betaproteobacteria bacterium]
MRVVLDTNVLLSAFIRVDSNPCLVLHAWLDGRFELVSSGAQIEEITRVARYPQVRRYISPAEVGWLVNRIRDRAPVIDRLPEVGVSADPGDNFLLGMAEAGQADYVVTGDKSDVLAIERHGRTKVVTVTRMMKALGLG